VLNTAAFAKDTSTAPPQQGNVPRNFFRGFPLRQFDISLARQFRLTEKLRVDLRADFFNLANHANFAPETASMSSGSFGQSISMMNNYLGSGNVAAGKGAGFNPLYNVGGARSIQLSLKVRF